MGVHNYVLLVAKLLSKVLREIHYASSPQACPSVSQVAAFTRCTFEIPASEYVNPFGLLLLSRYELTEVETVDYHPVEQVVLPRGYISAKVVHFRNILHSKS